MHRPSDHEHGFLLGTLDTGPAVTAHETHPRDQLLILQHRLHPPLELDLLLILGQLGLALFAVFLLLVDLEWAEEDGRGEPEVSDDLRERQADRGGGS